MGEIYVASEGPCTHKELSGSLHLCTVSGLWSLCMLEVTDSQHVSVMVLTHFLYDTRMHRKSVI